MRRTTYLYMAAAVLAPVAQAWAQPAPRPAEAEANLEEVVVVARQREERLQDVPVSVSAVSEELLANAGAGDARELTNIVPGYFGGRASQAFQPTIRGIGSQGVSIGDEANVAYYVDGVYQPVQLANIIDFVEVERVEVLRGPQGTLFGRNATGGLVNVITKDPTFEFNGMGSAQLSRFKGANEYLLTGYLDGPINDRLAANVSVAYRKSDDFIEDLVRGGEIGKSRSFTARAKLLFKPTDNIQAILTATHIDRETEEDAAAVVYNGSSQANTVPGAIVTAVPYTAALTLAPQDGGGLGTPSANSQVDAVSLRSRSDLGFATLETVHSYSQDRTFQTSDTDSTSLAINSNVTTYKNAVVTNEIRLLSNSDGPLQWIAGVYHFHLKGKQRSVVFNGVPATNFVAQTATMIIPELTTTAYAAFGEGSYDVTDKLNLTLGVRYSTENRTMDTRINGAANPPPGFPARTGYRSKWTYRAAALYRVTDSTNVYATYGTGFKSGVYNSGVTALQLVQPETVKSVEVGVKSQPTNWLRANLGLFHNTYKDLQLQSRHPTNGQFVLQNAADARTQGAELELEAIATDNLRFRLAVSLLDAEYKSFPGAQVFTAAFTPSGIPIGNTVSSQDMSGKKLNRAPSYTISFGPTWEHEFAGGTLMATANIFMSDEVYFDFSNRLVQPKYTTVSAAVSWTTADERLRLKLFGSNLTDKLVAQHLQAGAAGDRAFYERPRTIGIAVEGRF